MNREITSILYPITGDVISQAGNQKVTVVGIEAIAISGPPTVDGQVLQYSQVLNQWIPTAAALGIPICIFINGKPSSNDCYVGVNLPLSTNGTSIFINGA